LTVDYGWWVFVAWGHVFAGVVFVFCLDDGGSNWRRRRRRSEAAAAASDMDGLGRIEISLDVKFLKMSNMRWIVPSKSERAKPKRARGKAQQKRRQMGLDVLAEECSTRQSASFHEVDSKTRGRSSSSPVWMGQKEKGAA
jgi:hypothetical protein